MKFTAEDAFEARDCGESIMMTAAAAAALCHQHQATFVEFLADTGKLPAGEYDAADVLAWLGY